MSGGYAPVVVHPGEKIQTVSGAFQKPFFMGGSQVPTALHLHPQSYSGAGLSKHKNLPPTKIKLFLPK